MKKYGTHSAMQSTSASARAVQISMAQLLPVLSNLTGKLHMQAAVLAASSSWARDEERFETSCDPGRDNDLFEPYGTASLSYTRQPVWRCASG
jgi:hypothetical protein